MAAFRSERELSYLPRSSIGHLRATKKIVVEHARDRTNVTPMPRYGWTRSSIIQPASDATKPATSDGNGTSCGWLPAPTRLLDRNSGAT